MPDFDPAEIRGIVFDLDGTLYVNEPFAATIKAAAVDYIAALLGISTAHAAGIMVVTRQRLSQERGTVQTLSAVCVELGGDVRALHRHFQEVLHPEAFLVRDERVIGLLTRLAQGYALYIYTNNNRAVTTRIISLLGLDGLFSRIFSIDDSWQGKPDRQKVVRLLDETGLMPSGALFVGDRYDVDLRVPEELGCPVYLCQSVEQLLRLEGALAVKLPAA